MRFKKLDMSSEMDKKILLTYFFKKLTTVLDKDELLKISCICYDSEKKNLYSHTNRFQKELQPYENVKVEKEDVQKILQNVLDDNIKIQEELVQCELQTKNDIDYFYVTVIGVDFFLTENELKQ